ncbi:MAG: HAD-IA family hydrolase [Planctomycetota bacterium]
MTAATTPPPPRAVLFDLDGTLYEQAPLHRTMLRELALSPLRGPLRAARTLRRLQTFRRVREELRDLGDTAPSLDDAQYEVPAERLGDDAGALRETVLEWMHERPLRHLARAAWPGERATLEALRDLGLSLGVFSDYPPAKKLAALGIDDLFDVAIAATDPEVNAFKPHPRGFLVGAERLGVPPAEVLYVGDRAEVDALGAAGAGLECVLVGGKGAPADVATVPTFHALAGYVAGRIRG